jgi:hypothetical protein
VFLERSLKEASSFELALVPAEGEIGRRLRSALTRSYDAVTALEIPSAAPQHADNAPLPALKLGTMKVPAAMSKVPDLQIEVQETLRRIIVKMPGTAYETRFGLIPRGLCLLSGFGQDDRKARVTSQEFTLMAKAAATDKARELGWLIDEKRRRGWTDRMGD